MCSTEGGWTERGGGGTDVLRGGGGGLIGKYGLRSTMLRGRMDKGESYLGFASPGTVNMISSAVYVLAVKTQKRT